jgi:hypothetical protein
MSYYEDIFVDNEIFSPVKSDNITSKISENKTGYYDLKTVNKLNNKVITRRFYGSGRAGSIIRNAVTGAYNSSHKVGTADENNYFKVKLCVGKYGDDPIVFFFESRNEYDKYFSNKILL